MGKWANYNKNHKKDWESESTFRGWLTANVNSNNNGSSSFCKICNVELRSHKGDLMKHANTVKHKRNMNKISSKQLSIRKYGSSEKAEIERKRKEVVLAAYIAAHSSIRSIDHLTDIINSVKSQTGPSTSSVSSTSCDLDPHSSIYRLHRTKCSALIRTVLGPSILSALLADVGDSPFSLIIDESTDISNEKLICICIKYYSKSKNQIILQFLTFLPIVQATSENLYITITDFFAKHNFSLKNLIGIGTDGANNMCGIHHSLFTLFRDNLKLRNLVLAKCICHSLHLCGSKASEVFKDEVDFLLRETYNWFHNSTLRMASFKDVYNLINSDSSNFRKFTQLSTTRWLSRYNAVDKILNQFLELGTFFKISSIKEKCHTAKLLADGFADGENKLILIFLHPILKQIYQANLYFQRNEADLFYAYESVSSLIWSLARQILKPSLIPHLNNDFDLLNNALKHDSNYLSVDSCDLEYCLEQELSKTNFPVDKVNNFKKNFVEFIKILLLELIKRMPTHLHVFNKIKCFSPNVILNHKRPKFGELPLDFINSKSSLSDLELQYRNMLNINWSEVFEDKIPDDALVFWQKVIQLKNDAGDFLFKDLSLFAFTMLSLPTSNASVERAFSIMNLVKCKIRNRMMLDTLNNIMIIRSHFSTNNICCKDLTVTEDMLSRFNSSIYVSSTNSTVTSDDENEKATEELLIFCEEYVTI